MTTLNRRGMALPLALFALVIAAAMISAMFYFGMVEHRLGDATIATTQAFEAAEAGTSTMLTGWQTTTYNGMVVGDSIQSGTVAIGGGATYAAKLRRISPSTYVIEADGRLQRGSVVTRSRIARLVRLNIPNIDLHAAVTTRNGMSVTGSSQISGSDSVPVGWGATCPPPGPMVPGIRDSSGSVSTSGSCSGASCIVGSPKIQTDTSVNINSFNQFGDLTFADLAAQANKITGGTVTGVGPATLAGPPVSCNYSAALNWGDPLNPLGKCFDYFPIIYSAGDLLVSGGVGQGILLVGGNLQVSGGFQFFGPVIVQGTVTSTGTGGHIFGGLMAANANFTVSLLTGNSVVGYSSCAVDRAVRGSARAMPLAERSWAQVY
jgi:hypothetical protein